MSDIIPGIPVEEHEAPAAPPAQPDGASDASPPRRPTLPLCMHIVAPERENAVWTLLSRLPCRDLLGLRATVAIITVGCLAGLSGFLERPDRVDALFPLLFLAWMHLTPLLNLEPQAEFHNHVRRNGLGGELLSAPIPPDAYMGAFLRYYLAVLLQSAAAFAAFLGVALVAHPEALLRAMGDTEVQWFIAAVVALWSAVYWVRICRGPFLWFVAAYIILIANEIIDPTDTELRFFGGDYGLYGRASVVIWVGLAVAGMLYCRLFYAERLRERLFP